MTKLIPSKGGRLVEADKKILMVPLKLSSNGIDLTTSELGQTIRLPWSIIQRDYISVEAVVDGYPMTVYSLRSGGLWYLLGDDEDPQSSAWWNC